MKKVADENQSEKSDGKPYWYKIQNVVGTATLELDEKIDLVVVARKYSDVEYNPERFPGLIMRVKDPKATILIFSTGKLVITGMRAASEADSVLERCLERLRNCGVEVEQPEVIIQNIVASGDLNCLIDLNMATVVMEHTMYEPEVFPGLIYRMQDPKAVFLVFSTGKIVCTGAKSAEIVDKAVEKVYEVLHDYGVAQEEQEFEFDEGEDFSFL